jgi:hypothetical protein
MVHAQIDRAATRRAIPGGVPRAQIAIWALCCSLCAGRATAAPDGASSKAPSSTDAATPDAAARVDQARDAFVLGTTLANEGEWPEALNAFSRSSALRPHPVTTYDMAYCERAMGHYTRARKFFRQALAEHERGVNGTLPEDLLALAKGYLPEVERRLAHAFVRAELHGATVSVDGRPLEPTSAPTDARLVLVAGTRDDRGSEAPPASSFELLVDPGRHLIVLSRPGTADKLIAETFDAGAERNLLLSADLPPSPESTRRALPPEPASSSDNRTWMYVAYGAGGAGLLTGTVFGIMTLVKAGNLSDNCDAQKMCDPKYQADLDSANRDAVVATVGFGVAIAGAAAGTYLLLTGKHDDAKEKRKPSARVVVVPLLGPTLFGARGEF